MLILLVTLILGLFFQIKLQNIEVIISKYDLVLSQVSMDNHFYAL